MANLFNTLNIGYTGLSAAQVGISTTSQNVANAETEGYSRQRVITAAATPLSTSSGNVGNGTQVQEVMRIFDNFVFDSYTSVSSDKEYSDYEMQVLDELSTYFPEIDGVGIKSDMASYYDMWQTFSDNPDNDSIKIALAEETTNLADSISSLQSQVEDLQMQVNEELLVNVNQVNEIAEQLADVNRAIDIAEAGDVYTANDLRDKRNLLEKNMSELIGADVTSGTISANIQVDSNSNTATGSYTLSVNGFNIVDGTSYHPLSVSSEKNPSGFYEVSYERQDGVLIPMEEEITGGKIGAILDLRGGSIDTTSGMPEDGILQNVISQLDALSATLIEGTNNLYAANSTTRMTSNSLDISSTEPIMNSNLNVQEGSFDLVVYDIDGNETARRSITIDASTVLSEPNSNSIEAQIKAIGDDNGDSNANNDIDDFLTYSFQTSADGELKLELIMDPSKESSGYKFSIEDNLTDDSYSSGTNFAGALGLGRYLDGNDAQSISLNNALEDNPTNISAGYSGATGDNRIALSMVQQQFASYDFQVGSQTYNSTVYEMFDTIATYVGVTSNSAINNNDTVTTQYNAIQTEYDSISKVSIDEEMTNLIKYQTSYGAAAKVITTVDEMMQTLLGIKQ